MRTLYYERYGPPEVLELREVDRPVPAPGELLIRVEAASLNASDWESLVGRPAYARFGGLFRPRDHFPGSDIAGVVEAVGDGIERFQPGDAVFGDLLWHGLGGFAEYVSVPDKATLGRIPAGLSFDLAATLPQAGVIALQVTASIEKGQEVLITGAGGGAGTLAIQLARQAGARVTGVDNGWKLDLMRSLGADEVIDYTQVDYTRQGNRYHHIIDLAGHRSVLAVRRALADRGRSAMVGGSVPSLLQAALLGPLLRAGGRRMGVFMVRPNSADLTRVGEMVAAGTLTPAIDRIYPLERAAEAYARVGEGSALGKVILSIGA